MIRLHPSDSKVPAEILHSIVRPYMKDVAKGPAKCVRMLLVSMSGSACFQIPKIVSDSRRVSAKEA